MFDDYNIYDAHAHLGVTWPDERIEPTVEESIAMLDRCSIKKACISASRYLRFDFCKGNERVLELVQRYPDRLTGSCLADPTRVELSLEELEKHLSTPYFSGVKIHISHNQVPYNDTRYLPIYDTIQKYGAPILAHTFSPTEVRGFLEMAQKYPDLAFIVGHSGGYRWRETIDDIAAVENAFFDVCCSCPDAGRVEAFVAAAGPERVLLGTDLPMLSPAYNLSQIYHAKIGRHEKEKILGANIRRILGEKA